MSQDVGAAARMAAGTAALNKAAQQLMGIVSGLVADGELNDREVHFLRTWLTENKDVAGVWPGCAISRAVEMVLADGVITEAERTYLLSTLSDLAGTSFSQTGAVADEVVSLPIEDAVTVVLRLATVCHTGEFLFGTRAAVERATLAAGGTAVDAVSRKVDMLVIGTRVSPFWVNTSYGRKIQRAVELQEAGHPIEIISERRWFEALSA